MPLWEQRIKNAASQGREGFTARSNRGRVLVELRRAGEMKQSVMLTKELSWCESDEREITKWLDALYAQAEGEGLSLKVAMERVKPTSNRLGEGYAVSWSDIKEAYRVRKMDHGRKITAYSWDCNYCPPIDAALEVLAASKAADGATLLREACKRWADHYSSRANAVAVLKGFTEFAVRDSRFNAPESWLISEFDAAPIRGVKPDDDDETAALEDVEILELLDAVEKRWGEGWLNVISTLVVFGLRPGEVEKIELKTNGEGHPQMHCWNRKSGGRVRTQPRWLEEVPLTAADGTRVDLNVAKRWETMAWPQTRDGSRRKLTSHYIGQYLSKVPYWQQLKLEYAEDGLNVVPYSFRNSWNARAKALGIPDAIVSRAHGNTVATNTRSYRQATDQKARAAFRDALGR
jgi:integrase